MRLLTATPLKTLAVAAVLSSVFALTYFSIDGERPPLPQAMPVAAIEWETDASGQAAPVPRSDSDIEAEAARPIQKVVEAGRGDTLADLLIRAGIEKAEAARAIDALGEIYDPRSLRPGQDVTLTFVRPADGVGSGAFDAVSLQPEAGRQITARRSAGGFSASEAKRPVIRQLAHFSGTIHGSLFEAAFSDGVPAAILAEMIRAYSYDVDFQRDIQPGDRFEVMFERFVDSNGRVIRDGDILFADLTLSGEAMPIYRYQDAAGTADYYNANGESVKKALLRTPVDGARISSGFGMRMHPILGYSTMHRGIDFAVATGTPVLAAGAGVIDFAGPNSSYGYYVRIRHDAQHATAYAHLSRFAPGIRRGHHVAQGQIIAYSGATGRATGPHLHYEVLVNDQQMNPMSVKFQAGSKLAGKELAHFQSLVHERAGWLAQTPLSSRLALAREK
ncbi:MAG TPA: peptidoglycan DD-metalloendopeptidase family protein [Rhodospirillaceae bacterium]|nr:peptidoglycan DD-metalloendopeptidase family protein [Rhodospirillaceae bacterium]